MRKCAKRTVAWLLALMCMGGMTASAADGTAAVYVFSQEGNTLDMAQEEGALTFWEAPDVLTGQTRMGGTITLKNETDRTVDFVLSSVSLPYGDEAALTYLDAVSVDISKGDAAYYHGTFTHLMDSDRAEIRLSNVAPGEQRQLTLAISCAYTYAGQVPSYESLVWTFTPQIKEETPTTTTVDPLGGGTFTIDWLLIAEVAGALVLVTGVTGVCRWLIRRRNRKK